MMSALIILLPHRPWLETVRFEVATYLSRALFEVMWQVPDNFDIRVLDLHLSIKEGVGVEEAVAAELARHRPDVVLVSWPAFVLGDFVSTIVRTVAGKCRAPIVVGGSPVSLVGGEWILRTWPEVTVAYAGHGQEIGPLILAMAESDKVPDLPGVYSRIVKNSVPTGSRVLCDKYEAGAFYSARNRFDFPGHIARYRKTKAKLIGTPEGERGCSLGCAFCALNVRNTGFMTRSPGTVVKEVRFLASSGILEQQLIDPTLGLDRKGTVVLLEGLAEVKRDFPGLRLDVLTRPEFVTNESVRLYGDAGVWLVGLGMETMDQLALQGVQKTLKPSSTERAVMLLAEEGIVVKLFHIMFPRKFSFATIKFLSELDRRGVRFVVQSSFLRPLATPQSGIDFLSHDQTVWVPWRDSPEQMEEYMLTNLPYWSARLRMKMNPEGDPCLRELIAHADGTEELLKLFKIKGGGREVWLSVGNRKYAFIHSKKLGAVADRLFWNS